MPKLSKCWNSLNVFNSSFLNSCDFSKNKLHNKLNPSNCIITLRFRNSKWSSSILLNIRILSWLYPKSNIWPKSRIHYGLSTYLKLSLPLSHRTRLNYALYFNLFPKFIYYFFWSVSYYCSNFIINFSNL